MTTVDPAQPVRRARSATILFLPPLTTSTLYEMPLPLRKSQSSWKLTTRSSFFPWSAALFPVFFFFFFFFLTFPTFSSETSGRRRTPLRSSPELETKELVELQESRNELLSRVSNLKRDLQDWRQADNQVKSYRSELGSEEDAQHGGVAVAQRVSGARSPHANLPVTSSFRPPRQRPDSFASRVIVRGHDSGFTGLGATCARPPPGPPFPPACTGYS